MTTWLSLLDGFTVSLFGSVLSASFCSALNTRKKQILFWCFAFLLPLVQGAVYFLYGGEILRQVYPLVVHLPLMLVLWFLSRKPVWSLLCVFFAYLCCQLRRWLALLVVTLASGGETLQYVAQLVITVPLAVFLLKVFAPAVRGLHMQSMRTQLRFGMIPAIYYGFDYLTVVYTDLLLSGNPVAVEFMPFVCCSAYLVFILYSSYQTQKHFRLQQTKKVLDTQLNQSVREISALRESQVLAQQYRHDLRHHLQYVAACIENGQSEQAKSYIAGICQEIDMQKVRHYCENEAANLILSAFADRAKKAGIGMNITGALPAFIPISDRDLCVLLSNALENALHACQRLGLSKEARTIDVHFFDREGKLFLQITNPCQEDILFENGIPVSNQRNHGIGVQSICAIVERYGGVHTFTVQDGNFILRLSL